MNRLWGWQEEPVGGKRAGHVLCLLGCEDKRGQKARWATFQARPRWWTELLKLSRVAGAGDSGDEGRVGRRENDVKDSEFGKTKRNSNCLEAGKKKNVSRLKEVLEFQPGIVWK